MTVHSVFIGLTVGTASDRQLKVLLIVLSFHQFFEGVALGSRFVDSEFKSCWVPMVLSVIFSISAPIGLAAGLALLSGQGMNPNGTKYLLLQGTFDGACAGILLYLGFGLLLHDFQEDLVKHASSSQHGPCARARRRAAMFGGLWGGAGVMAVLALYM